MLMIETETLPGGTRVFCDENHRVTTDSLLLAQFCQPKRDFSVCEFGAGCGIVILSIIDGGLCGTAVGIEREQAGYELLKQGMDECKNPNAQAVLGDIRNFSPPRPIDMVVANPPYFTSGLRAAHPSRAGARHETDTTINQWCIAAGRVLKDGGRFCVCWPPVRLAGLFGGMQNAGIAPKRLQLVRKTPEDAPWLALIDGRKAGGEGLTIMPDLLLPAGSPVKY